MNPEIKKAWVAALCSGDYRQGKGRLRTTGNGTKHCCLGVLCELHSKSTGTAWDDSDNTYMDEGYQLPRTVVEWAGLESENPNVLDKSLSDLNDEVFDARPAPFNEIARIIEENL